MFLRLDGTTFQAQVSGPANGEVLFLLHSLGTNAGIWEEPAQVFSNRYRVIRPDLRGHGMSGVTPGPYSIEGMARDMLGLLDLMGVESAHVAGISIGGMIAQSLAAQAPGRVRSLTLVDTALAIPPAQTWTDRAATVRAEGMAPLVETVVARWVTPASLGEPRTDALRAMLRRTDPEGYAGAAEAIAAADLTETSRRIAVPTLVLVGDGDQATPLASAEALRDTIPGARLEVISDAAHIPTMESPEAVTAAMRGFLGAQAPASGGDAYAAGLAVRKSVLGEAHVARASAAVTPLDQPFQDYITRNVWGQIWTRPGLPRHTRSLLTLAMMAALGREDEFVLHVRATRNTGVSPEEIAEVLLQVGAYAGVPAANHALKLAKKTLKEMAEEAP